MGDRIDDLVQKRPTVEKIQHLERRERYVQHMRITHLERPDPSAGSAASEYLPPSWDPEEFPGRVGV
jgi:hypothetical protein